MRDYSSWLKNWKENTRRQKYQNLRHNLYHLDSHFLPLICIQIYQDRYQHVVERPKHQHLTYLKTFATELLHQLESSITQKRNSQDIKRKRCIPTCLHHDVKEKNKEFRLYFLDRY